MKTERMERAKNIAAQQYGFESWENMFDRLGHEPVLMLPGSQIEKVIERAMVIYSLEFSGVASYDGSNIPAVAYNSFYAAAQKLSLVEVRMIADTAARMNSHTGIGLQVVAFEKLTAAMKSMRISLVSRPRTVIPEKFQPIKRKN